MLHFLSQLIQAGPSAAFETLFFCGSAVARRRSPRRAIRETLLCVLPCPLCPRSFPALRRSWPVKRCRARASLQGANTRNGRPLPFAAFRGIFSLQKLVEARLETRSPLCLLSAACSHFGSLLFLLRQVAIGNLMRPPEAMAHASWSCNAWNLSLQVWSEIWRTVSRHLADVASHHNVSIGTTHRAALRLGTW